MIIRKIVPTELAWINDQYASIDFALSSELDFIAVAEIDGKKVGIGRLTELENGAAELGGIYVLPSHRGQSIAAAMVEFLLENSTHSPLFCIPFANLEKFYRRFGFLPPDQKIAIPAKTQHKIQWCATQYNSPVVLLCR